MFRRFENLGDPFAPYAEGTPPHRYQPFVWSHVRDLKGVMLAAIAAALVVATQPDTPPLWPYLGANPMKSFELGAGIQAHFWERDGMASWQWSQNDAFYVLTYNQAIFSEAAAIAMATSMATEPPFTP